MTNRSDLNRVRLDRIAVPPRCTVPVFPPAVPAPTQAPARSQSRFASIGREVAESFDTSRGEGIRRSLPPEKRDGPPVTIRLAKERPNGHRS